MHTNSLLPVFIHKKNSNLEKLNSILIATNKESLFVIETFCNYIVLPSCLCGKLALLLESSHFPSAVLLSTSY